MIFQSLNPVFDSFEGLCLPFLERKFTWWFFCVLSLKGSVQDFQLAWWKMIFYTFKKFRSLGVRKRPKSIAWVLWLCDQFQLFPDWSDVEISTVCSARVTDQGTVFFFILFWTIPSHQWKEITDIGTERTKKNCVMRAHRAAGVAWWLCNAARARRTHWSMWCWPFRME